MDERARASFDAAGESVKQLLALATVTIGGTIALFDDQDAVGVNMGDGYGVYFGLTLLAISVNCGLFTLGTLAGQLGSDQVAAPSTYALPVRVMAGGQQLSYGLSIVLLVATALFNI